MRAVIQRVTEARVDVAGRPVGAIGPGLLVLAGFETADAPAGPDTADDLAWVAGKIARLRIFSDADGTMNRSAAETGAAVLAVSQFTLFASTKKGNRPSWSRAARPEIAEPLFRRFVACLEDELGRPVPTGVFGADMRVHLINDGPVTLVIDSRQPE